jgi:signal transduction histidine kinase/ActR/RegA family two-component response regulator
MLAANPLHWLRREAAYDPLLDTYRCRADGIMVGTNVLMLLVCLGVAPLNGTWLAVGLIGVPTVLLAWWLKTQQPGALLTRVYMGLAFMTFTGLLIHQTGGDIEAHFSAFGLIAVLLYYRDWRTIVAATVFVYLHHLVLGYAQTLGFPIYVFDNPQFWLLFLVHVAYFLPFIALMAYLAIWLRRDGVEHQVLINEDQEIKARLQAAKEAAERANQYKNEFLANISHEIRTPLNGVLGMVQIAMQEPLSHNQREYLQLAHVSAQQLLRIINDVLDFSKIESGAIDMNPESVNLKRLSEQNMALYSRLADAAGKAVQFGYDIDPSLPPRVWIDDVRVRQILNNLLGNALKFTEQGRVHLSWRAAVSPPDGDAQTWLEFDVTDTGIGFDMRHKDKLFQPFVQGDGSVTRRYGGTGLGLSICAELAKKMGGRIDVTSEPGKGSTFTCRLPYSLPPDDSVTAPAALHPQPPGAAQPLRLLLVEDDPINQQVIGIVLEKSGHTVTLAGHGRAGLERYLGGDFDLVLMDVMMPHMGGMECLQAIRQHERATGRARTPVLMLTANAVAGNPAVFQDAGADGYLTKPVQSATLLSAIARAASHTPGAL